jgi:hypothetical protein
MCPNFNLLKTYKVYPRKIDFNYRKDKFFIYIYLNPFKELSKAESYRVQGKQFCFAYEPIYLGKGTGAGYRQHQHITSFISGKEKNKYKLEILTSIKDAMANAAAVRDHTKPWNWKEYQKGYVIVLETFQDPKQLLKFEMELINSIGIQHDKSGPLSNKIKNAYSFDNLSDSPDIF